MCWLEIFFPVFPQFETASYLQCRILETQCYGNQLGLVKQDQQSRVWVEFVSDHQTGVHAFPTMWLGKWCNIYDKSNIPARHCHPGTSRQHSSPPLGMMVIAQKAACLILFISQMQFWVCTQMIWFLHHCSCTEFNSPAGSTLSLQSLHCTSPCKQD